MAHSTDRDRLTEPGRYLVAVAVTALAAGMWLLLALTVEAHPPMFVLFTGAVGISAWVGGIRPALVSIVLSAFLSLLFLHPWLSFEVADWAELLDLCIFIGVDLGVALVVQSLHTARRNAEARARDVALASAAERAWKERYEAAVRASGHVLYDIDRIGGRVMFGGACERILGYSPEELGGGLVDWRSIVHPDDAPRYDRFRPDGDAVGLPELEYRVRHRSGRYVTLHDVGEQLRGPDGRVVRVVGFLADVTEQRRIEAAVRASEERLRLAVEATGLGVTLTTFQPDGSSRFECTQETREIFGFPADQELTLSAVLARVHADDVAAVHAALGADVDPRGDGRYHVEFRVHHPSGALRWVSSRGRATFDGAGRLLRNIGVVQDITDSKTTAAQLAESFALIDTLVVKAPIGMAFLDTEFRYVRINEKLAAAGGLPAAAHIGRTVADVVPELWPPLEPMFRRALATGREEVDVEVCGETRAMPGQVRCWNVSLYPIRTPDTLLGLGLAVVETTAQKRVEASLREADRRKDEFIATLAHELRNPLAPIRTSIALLRLAPGRAECLDVIGRQVDHMNHLLEDLLDVSRITRGKLSLRRGPVALQDVMDRAIETSRPLIAAKGHRLEVALPAEPVCLDADPLRLAQVFSNLITNAAKYSESRGQIRVAARVHGQAVEISVKDAGVGIAAEHLPRVFEMFSQVSPAHERSEGGLGIGLALSRGLVEMHGGAIEAHSAGLGQGSEFVVRLPIARVRSAAPPPASRVDHDASLGHRILVADDNVDNADSLAMFLRTFGNDVRTAYDGPDAAAVCAEFRPDVAFLDIGMPRMSGWEVSRWIRDQPWGDKIVLIAQTGWGQREDRRQSEDAGFDYHMTKPLDLDRLVALLAELPHRPADQDSLRGSPGHPARITTDVRTD